MTTGRINQVASVQRRAPGRAGGNASSPRRDRARRQPPREEGRSRMREERNAPDRGSRAAQRSATAAATRPTRSQSPRSEFHRVDVRHGDGPGEERRASRMRDPPLPVPVGDRAIVAQGGDPRPPVTLRPPEGEEADTDDPRSPKIDRGYAHRRQWPFAHRPHLCRPPQRRPGLGRRRPPARRTPAHVSG
jgi:hypothetical protein